MYAMVQRASNERDGRGKRRKRGRPFGKGGGPRAFKPGTSGNPHRGPDVRPRKQVVATAQMAALFQEQVRDPRTGRLSRSKWARPIAGAGLRDLVRFYARALYAGAHGDPAEAAALASAVTKIGEHFGAYLDDKPSSQPRVTIFNVEGGRAERRGAPDQGRRQLSTAEEGYVEVREEGVPG